MALTLLHEMMHTFELPDQYENGDWHCKKDENYCCIMEIYEKDYAWDYYQALLYGDDLTNVFCPSCSELIEDIDISTKQYIGNLGGER